MRISDVNLSFIVAALTALFIKLHPGKKKFKPTIACEICGQLIETQSYWVAHKTLCKDCYSAAFPGDYY